MCSVVVEFSGSPTDGELCRDCTYAWDVTAEVLETDCTGELPEDPGFVSLSRVGIGPVPQDLTTDDPYPGQSQGTFVDYSEGSWVPYGWAYPESLDNRGSAETTEWDGEQAFQMWPGYVWSLVR